jgi:hypothetical protein
MKIEVEVEKYVIPKHVELIRIGKPKRGEKYLHHFSVCKASEDYRGHGHELIVRDVWEPSPSILRGLWVFPDDGNWYLCGCEPHQTSNGWTSHLWQHRLPEDFIPPPDGQPRQIK